MEGLLVFAVMTASLALLGALAYAFGVDTRPGFIDPRQPADRAV